MDRLCLAALCLTAALGLSAVLGGCSFFKGGEDASSAGVSSFGSAADYAYETFDYSQGLDANGYWDGITALDYVTLPEDFASIQLKKADVEPSEEAISNQWDYLLSMYSTAQTVSGRAAAEGDIANIDYSGSVDGVVFTGGTAEGYDLTLGSGQFIDGFEDQIVGHLPGDVFDVVVTFPEGYGDSTDAEGNVVPLGGREAVFSVTLNSLSETVLPEATDAWVEENFGESDDIHTVEALNQYFYDITLQSNLDSAILSYLLDAAKFSGCPEVISEYQVTNCLNYYYQMAGYYGYSLDEFIPLYAGYDSADAMLADYEQDLRSYCNEALLYQAVAESLDLLPSEASCARYTNYANVYGENYVKLLALTDDVTAALRDGVQLV